MSNEHRQHGPADADGASGEAIGSGPHEALPSGESLSAEAQEDLIFRLKAAEARATENLEGWQRSQAEFQNYRKRVERDAQVMQAAMKADILRQVLPILDDLERALQNRPSDTGPWVSGIELIHRKLKAILEAQGVSRIEAEGQPFDPALHEAISHEQAETVKSGHVIAVTQNGYMLGDQVIRPATVRVAQ